MVLVALDLDGTALDSNGKLSQSVAEAIRQRAKSKKYIFAFCSGRPLSGVLPHAQAVGIAENYHVLANVLWFKMVLVIDWLRSFWIFRRIKN